MPTIPLPSREAMQVAYHEGEESVLKIFEQLVSVIQTLEFKIQAFEYQKNKDCHNSIKPPAAMGTRSPPCIVCAIAAGRKRVDKTGTRVFALRELIFVTVQYHQTWATEMRDLLLNIKDTVETAKVQEQTSLSRPQEQAFQGEYDRLVRLGYPPHVEGQAKSFGRFLLLRG